MAMYLSTTEREIMNAIWAKGGAVTTRDLAELSELHGWKAPTLLAFLKRLCDKGFLATQKSGKLRTYLPIASQEEYVKKETDTLVSELYNGKVSNLIASLTEQGALSKADQEALQKILDGEWK